LAPASNSGRLVPTGLANALGRIEVITADLARSDTSVATGAPRNLFNRLTKDTIAAVCDNVSFVDGACALEASWKVFADLILPAGAAFEVALINIFTDSGSSEGRIILLIGDPACTAETVPASLGFWLQVFTCASRIVSRAVVGASSFVGTFIHLKASKVAVEEIVLYVVAQILGVFINLPTLVQSTANTPMIDNAQLWMVVVGNTVGTTGAGSPHYTARDSVAELSVTAILRSNVVGLTALQLTEVDLLQSILETRLYGGSSSYTQEIGSNDSQDILDHLSTFLLLFRNASTVVSCLARKLSQICVGGREKPGTLVIGKSIKATVAQLPIIVPRLQTPRYCPLLVRGRIGTQS
jgi:hypothetical protein